MPPLHPLIAIAREGDPFTATDGRAFVRLQGPSFQSSFVLPVRSVAFRNWFFHEYYSRHEAVPDTRAFHALLNHLEAEANHSNQGFPVFRRVAGVGLPTEKILLDLGNPQFQVVEIAAGARQSVPQDQRRGVLIHSVFVYIPDNPDHFSPIIFCADADLFSNTGVTSEFNAVTTRPRVSTDTPFTLTSNPGAK